MNKDFLKLDKKSFSVVSLQESDNDIEYWLSRTPEERIIAVEFLRQLIFNYDPSTERLQRVFETAEFKTN
jgi:hypothetical protein